MTNDEIQEASRLIGEIERLEFHQKDKKAELVIAYGSSGRVAPTMYWPVSEIEPKLVAEIIGLAINAKKARLNDLRAGC